MQMHCVVQKTYGLKWIFELRSFLLTLTTENIMGWVAFVHLLASTRRSFSSWCCLWVCLFVCTITWRVGWNFHNWEIVGPFAKPVDFGGFSISLHLWNVPTKRINFWCIHMSILLGMVIHQGEQNVLWRVGCTANQGGGMWGQCFTSCSLPCQRYALTHVVFLVYFCRDSGFCKLQFQPLHI